MVQGAGYAPVDYEFIDALVASLIPHVKGGDGSTMMLHGYKPPYDVSMEEAQTEPDFMEFWITSPSVPDVAFSISFGGKNPSREAFVELTLDNLQAVARNGDPINLEASVASFDELWLFACQFGEAIRVESVKIIYGI